MTDEDAETPKRGRDWPHDPEELARRTRWFHFYVDHLNSQKSEYEARDDGKFACPCCHFFTLDSRADYDICPICFWEDDGQDDDDADMVLGGPNGSLSLTQARENYRSFRASEQRLLPFVRAPLPDEHP